MRQVCSPALDGTAEEGRGDVADNRFRENRGQTGRLLVEAE